MEPCEYWSMIVTKANRESSLEIMYRTTAMVTYYLGTIQNIASDELTALVDSK